MKLKLTVSVEKDYMGELNEERPSKRNGGEFQYILEPYKTIIDFLLAIFFLGSLHILAFVLVLCPKTGRFFCGRIPQQQSISFIV